MAQPIPAAPQQAPVMDPNFAAWLQQQMALAAQATGGTYTPPPPALPELEWPQALQELAARVRWHSEDQQNAVHRGIARLVSAFQSMEQDLAAIRARLPVIGQPVTQDQAAVLAGAGQLPPGVAVTPPAPAQQQPFPFPFPAPGQATFVTPAPGGVPPFAANGQPVVPPVPPAPPQAATFAPQPFPGMPSAPPAVPVG